MHHGGASLEIIGVVVGRTEVVRAGRVGEGSRIMMVAFGAGFTWASMIVRL